MYRVSLQPRGLSSNPNRRPLINSNYAFDGMHFVDIENANLILAARRNCFYLRHSYLSKIVLFKLNLHLNTEVFLCLPEASIL